MTYLGFHFVFIVPVIVLLALALRLRRPPIRATAWWFLPLIVLIAFVYTTPWDNYLVWREIWWYGPDRVIGTIGYVPIEEYMFFGLQPVLTGLWTYLLLALMPVVAAPLASRPPGRIRAVGAGIYLFFALIGVAFLFSESTLYMGLILAWACPVLAGQWAFAGGQVWARRRFAALAVAVPTLYLWIADAVAIGLGIWEISPRYTMGFGVATLPIEEATFFLVTNLLVVQGLILFLFPPSGPPRTVAAEGAPAGGGMRRAVNR